MTIVNMQVKDLCRFIMAPVKIHLVVYNNSYYPDFIGKLSELGSYRLYDSIYDARVDRLFYSLEDPKILMIYVALNE